MQPELFSALATEHTDHTADPGGRAGPGCRLHRLEVYNWGTFHGSVWTFEVGGANALLTGDIGSGKSTLVDAVTTLLLPANRISYNKAAGADVRERDLRSYVLGHYKSEHNEETGGTRPVGLRGPEHYSVLLAVFGTSPGVGATRVAPITIAQVFRAREDGSQPERFYLVAEADLSIAEHFALEPGDTFRELRGRLRARGANIFDHFPDYGRAFRRRLGIESEQVLDLFHQTVSMKAVDNLNDFVRSHMLEPFDMAGRIQALIVHFDDLTKAHDAVIRARHQLELLDPLVGHLDDHDAHAAAIAAYDLQRQALPLYFAERTSDLLHREIERLDAEAVQLEAAIGAVDDEITALHDRETRLTVDIAQSGGDRLAALDSEIDRTDGEIEARREALDRFTARLARVGLDGPDTITTREQFAAVHARIAARAAELDTESAELDNRVVELTTDLRRLEAEAEAVNVELRSLGTRKSNLPARSLELRDDLCAELGLDSDELPFVGELLQVHRDGHAWEGAAERVLRNFALSLLVPHEHYAAVARWIDGRHLGTRLVYFRVPARLGPTRVVDRSTTLPLLLDMVEVKPETSFGPWLRNELAHRADHVCVDDVGQLAEHDKAITAKGQVKARDRHEKDDRSRIDDRRTYVLGWTNEAKIDTLIDHAAAIQADIAATREALASPSARRRSLNQQVTDLGLIADVDRWDRLDWMSLADHVESLHQEAARIRTSSDLLATLTAELEGVKAEQRRVGGARSTLVGQRGGVTREREGAVAQLAGVEKLLVDGDVVAAARQHYAGLEESIPSEGWPLLDQLRHIGTVRDATSEAVATSRGQAADRRQEAANRAIRLMRDFRNAYAAESAELDDSIESGGEYRLLRDRVAGDDLPRFEAEFRRSLRENTINEVAGLSAQLQSQADTIRERIARINDSLEVIDYSPGRFIRLKPDPTPNTEIRQFQEDLRACTSNLTAGAEDDQYSEIRFLQVKALIERFRGREGSTDADRTWTRRVTDVRQWFVFSASERWRETDEEHESYSDSSGKSGGQKEKLAYTILAASLAYQFRLDRADEAGRTFRFVVIDEAFGRGSDESTRYALGLFAELGLQLLIVTPLQKIHVIEPHVACVGFVQNTTGDRSQLQRLTIEEHRTRRAEALRRAAVVTA